MLHPGTEHFLDISAWRSDGEIVPELVLESGIVSKIFSVVLGSLEMTLNAYKVMSRMPKPRLDWNISISKNEPTKKTAILLFLSFLFSISSNTLACSSGLSLASSSFLFSLLLCIDSPAASAAIAPRISITTL